MHVFGACEEAGGDPRRHNGEHANSTVPPCRPEIKQQQQKKTFSLHDFFFFFFYLPTPIFWAPCYATRSSSSLFLIQDLLKTQWGFHSYYRSSKKLQFSLRSFLHKEMKKVWPLEGSASIRVICNRHRPLADWQKLCLHRQHLRYGAKTLTCFRWVHWQATRE